MQANNKSIKRISNGSLRQEDTPLHILVIEFIERNVLFFIRDYIDGEAEKGLNSNFVLCMNNLCTNELFIFHHEDIETPSSGISPSIDIGVYTKAKGRRGQRFFALEAKRLCNSLPLARKKEYVIGHGGGIERFKRDIHASKLTNAAMLGYVQTDSFDIWKTRINDWINDEITFSSSPDLKWFTKDSLIEEYQSLQIAKFKSSHSRISKSQITLIHLWINLVKSDFP